MSSSDLDSDYDYERGETKPFLPALPSKATGVKRKAGGAGKKVKVFATTRTMLELVDEVNSVQESKVKGLLERDGELSKRLAQRAASKKERQDTKKRKLDRAKESVKAGKNGQRTSKGPDPYSRFANEDDGAEEPRGKGPRGAPGAKKKRVSFAAADGPKMKGGKKQPSKRKAAGKPKAAGAAKNKGPQDKQGGRR